MVLVRCDNCGLELPIETVGGPVRDGPIAGTKYWPSCKIPPEWWAGRRPGVDINDTRTIHCCCERCAKELAVKLADEADKLRSKRMKEVVGRARTIVPLNDLREGS